MTDASIGRYIGIPWLSKGHGFQGCDCWGLFRLFYINEYEITLPDLIAGDAMYGVWNKVPMPMMGDLLLFRTESGPHVGIALNRLEMLHIDECADSRIENYKGLKWNHRLRRIYRHRGLA